MKINWKSWKVGAALGSFVPLSFCAGFLFHILRWDGPLVAAMIVSTVSILLLLAWATCRTTSWKLWAAVIVAFLSWVAFVYWTFFSEQQVNNCSCVVPRTYTSSEISQLKEKAEKGDWKAMVEISSVYENGTGVKKDAAEAEKWYGKVLSAADQGNAEAQY